jgi:hypothetical protein
MSGRKWGERPAAPGVRPYRFRMREPVVSEPRKEEARVDPDRVARVADLVKEFCPDLDPVLAESYAAEALAEDDLPTVEELEPQARWRAIRESAPPPKLSRRLSTPYAERRGHEADEAAPRKDDFQGMRAAM